MSFMIRQIKARAKLADEIALEAIAKSLPQEVVRSIVSDQGVSSKRQRKLPAEAVMLLSIAMNLFCRESIEMVLVKMLKGLRLVWPDPVFVTASKGAICQARYRLGARPIVALFHRVCRPLATPMTQGAFLFGRRLMALDLTFEDLANSPENARAFGRPNSGRGPGAYPQLMAVYLSECGTHAIVDAGLWPCHANHHACAQRLLRSVEKDQLLSWDSGLHSFLMAHKTNLQGADYLSRVPAGVRLPVFEALSDGSYLSHLLPDQTSRRQKAQKLLTRVIEYTITDPNRSGYGQVHRLITSLLDPKQCPAIELILAYHERWEIELTIDELDTHQRLPNRPLRSKRPIGVIQELYGLLIAHYCVRALMHECAVQQGIDPDRLSFVGAVRLICEAISDFQQVEPREHPILYQRLLDDLARHRLPKRANRINPRVVKRKLARYPTKRPEHYHCPKLTLEFQQAVTILNHP